MATFTSFIDIDEFMFNENDQSIIEYLEECLKNGTYWIKMEAQHAPHRVCFPNQRMTTIKHFMVMVTFHLWSPKIIAKTNEFLPNVSIHEGTLKPSSTGTKMFSKFKDLRIKHFHMELTIIGRYVHASLITSK